MLVHSSDKQNIQSFCTKSDSFTIMTSKELLIQHHCFTDVQVFTDRDRVMHCGECSLCGTVDF